MYINHGVLEHLYHVDIDVLYLLREQRFAWSVGVLEHYIVFRKLLDSILNILLVFMNWWEIQIFLHRACLP